MKKGGHVQIVRKRIGIATMALGLLVALACGGAFAVAAGGYPDGGTNVLTVTASNTTDEAFAEAIAKTDVVVDVYKIADAAPDDYYARYNYTLVAPFDRLGAVDEANIDSAGWQKLADSAAKLVTADMDMLTVAADGATGLDLPSDGLYLLMPHGAGQTLEYGDGVAASLVAKSDLNAFVFAPSITAAPTKEAGEDGSIGTADEYGDWIRDIQVSLKPEMEPLYGNLLIDKTVTDGTKASVPATFVFRITGTTPDGKAYQGTVSFDYTGGAGGTAELTHIPAGTTVTVIEEYDGAGYRKVSGDGSTATIVADDLVQAGAAAEASVSFVNEPVDTPVEGHGIQNNFELVKTGEAESAWDWKWTAVPVEGDTAEAEE